MREHHSVLGGFRDAGMPFDKLPQQKPNWHLPDCRTAPTQNNSMGPENLQDGCTARQFSQSLIFVARPTVLLGELRGQKVVQLGFACPTVSNPIWEYG